MLTRDDIEGFLDRLSAKGETYEEIEQGLWVVRPGGNLELDVVVHYSPPVVVLPPLLPPVGAPALPPPAAPPSPPCVEAPPTPDTPPAPEPAGHELRGHRAGR